MISSPEAKQVPTFETILRTLGDFGPYQRKAILLLCIPASFLNAWTYFDLVFMLYAPAKTCQRWNTNISIDNLANVTDQCELEGRDIDIGNNSLKLHCEQWSFDTEYFVRTVYTEWAVCKNDILFKNILGIMSIVATFGLIFMSMVQDWLGRKWTFFICLAISLAGNGFALLAPSLVVWVVLRAISVSQNPTTYELFFIWAEEFVGPQKRTLVTFMMALFYSCATVTVGLVAWACRTWIQLGMATCFPFIILFAYYFLVDESPRWLLSVGKVKEATAIIEKMAKQNKKEAELENIRNQIKQIIVAGTVPRERRLSIQSVSQYIRKISSTSMASAAQNMSKFKPLDLVRYSHVRMKLLFITVSWTANSLTYTTLAFNAPNLGSNMFVAYIAQAAMEAPACIFNLLLSNRTGRIPPMGFAYFFSSFFSFMCIPASMLEWNNAYMIVFFSLAKFGICVSLNIMYQAASELYPTALRGTGIGVNMFVAGFFMAVMPYILGTAELATWVPMAILGCVTFLGGICVCFLPEPMDQAMPQTAAEAELVSKVQCKNVCINARDIFRCHVRKVADTSVSPS